MNRLNIYSVRNIKNRYEKPLDLISVVRYYLFWISVIVILILLIPERAWDLKMDGFISIAVIGLWRYSWQIINFVQSLVYEYKVYPRLKKMVKNIPLDLRYPRRVFFVIPSYKENPEVSRVVFKYLVEECYKLNSDIYFYVSVGSKEEVEFIGNLIEIYDINSRIKVKFLYQKQGKRVAFYHALRAVARDFYDVLHFHKDYYNDVLVLMDGDTVVGKDCLIESLPYFILNKKLGALTTDEEVYYHGKNKYVGMWYRIKFAKRDMMMKSHSLHRKVLTLTGRFSAFRAHILLKEEFINMMAKDNISHWLFGKFRFLMGDDKTTWFYLLKEGWEMMYIPDVWIFSVENRSGNFFSVSISLMIRWYGNMLRNNWRAIKLGPKVIGSWFIWLAIIDQRLSMWTSLVGPTVATFLSVFVSPFYWFFYVIWIIIVRLFQSIILLKEKVRLHIIDMLFIVYDQWVGSVVKIYASMNLSKQKWSKGKEKEQGVNREDFSKTVVKALLLLTYLLNFLIILGIYSKVFKLPSLDFLIIKYTGG